MSENENADTATAVEDERAPALEGEIGLEFHDAVLTEIKAMENPWSMLTEDDQFDIVLRIDRRKEALLKAIVPTLLNHEFTTVRAQLGDIAIKPKEIAAKVTFAKDSPDRHDIFDHSGGQVLIALIDSRSFDAPPAADQEELPFDPDESG